MLRLRGSNALSSFRLNKLLAAVHHNVPYVSSIEAHYWHFVATHRPLSPIEQRLLERLLTYGPAAGREESAGELFLVIPRLGTISPWSSKATDIARNCGLDQVSRIERGLAYRINTEGGKRVSATARMALLDLIHDRMTESVLSHLDDAEKIFERHQPVPLASVDILGGGMERLHRADREMGLALSSEEIAYLFDTFKHMQRNPTDVELMMFAQANSEHCRHKIFNGSWIIDGAPQAQTLFDMIRATHQLHPEGTVMAYADNSAIMEGVGIRRFYPDGNGQRYGFRDEQTHIIMKVETHNHPTAIAPFPGAATGVGGEIRDEGATGRGAKPKAGLCGFSVSNLNIPGYRQPWEKYAGKEAVDGVYGKPARIVSALQVMLEGPIGGAAFNNEFGRPNLCGYFRTYEEHVAGEMRGYHKPIMLAGGLGNIGISHTTKNVPSKGALLIQLGGPALLIGLGGGAASSMDTGVNTEALDFDSVQRGNAEIQRRAQEVIDRCWQLGKANPIVTIHDVGAGGLSNALPELVHAVGRGGRFQLRAILNEEPGMSPMQIWCNEAQERYVLCVEKKDLDVFAQMCKRERCPYAIVGEVTDDGRLVLEDSMFKTRPVDMELAVLLGKPPRPVREVKRLPRQLPAFDPSSIGIEEAVGRVLRLPTVANKTFLISIGDRTVGGLTARDQFVGPWQVPVADVAVTLSGYSEYSGEAMAIGERTPAALVSSPAAARMAVGEAITNMAAADIRELGRVKLSANWMAAAGHPGEDAALFDAVCAVATDLCPQLGISIPVGKDSLSMKTVWEEGGVHKEVTAPASLVVSAFAPVEDARKTLTPQLQAGGEPTKLILIDLGIGKNRLGASALAQVYKQTGNTVPDVDDPGKLKAFFQVIQSLLQSDVLLAYHDRSDGGVLVTLCEMMFASHKGLTVTLDPLVGRDDVQACMEALFNEELGAVVQIRTQDEPKVLSLMREAGLGADVFEVAALNEEDNLVILYRGQEIFKQTRVLLQRIWSETTFHMQKLRDNPDCAQQEFDSILDTEDAGLHAALSFDPDEKPDAPYVNAKTKPRIAILREQGVNGHVEMAAAFDRAGFEAVDVHMSDILNGDHSLKDFKGMAACGGFSYGDVLGAGEGWAKSILFNPRAREEFEAFFARPDSFALGVCNGCQMMSNLAAIIPGAQHWPHFIRNRSEQFEARFVMVEIQTTASIFFAGMGGARLPIVVSHGEGYAEFSSEEHARAARHLATVKYVDHHGAATLRYPFNPNGSPGGMTGFTTADGRFSIMMPHPERVFRTVQNSWHPEQWQEDSPWMRIFHNARKWVD